MPERTDEQRERARVSQKKWREANPGRATEKAAHWNKVNREKHNAHVANWRARNPEQVERTRLWVRYRTTPEYVAELTASRNGLCWICGLLKPLQVDHCHETGKIRGMLCKNCNLLLGNAKDSLATLENAIKYLKGQ